MLVAQHTAQGRDQTRIEYQRFTLLVLADQFLQHLHRQLLAGVPTVEAVAVVLHQEHQLVAVIREAQLHRCREAPQQGRQRLGVETDEGEGLLGFGHREHAAGSAGCRFTAQLQGDFSTLGIQQADLHRNHERQFFLLVRGLRAALAEGQAVGPGARIVAFADGKTRRTGLAVPAFELSEVDAIGIFHGLDEIVAGHGLAVMALEVQVAAFTETFGTEQGVDHADHFRALLVDGQGVEVGNLDKAVRAHGVGHGAGIFGELVGPQVGHVLDPLDGARVHVGGEAGIAEHREAFLERQLEPVAAGHAVARPVVEVFVGDDGLDPLVRGVGGGFGTGQHGAGVEDIEALVLHGAHVEVIDRDDHEDVQVVLATIDFLVPAHGLLQAVHGVLALVDIFRLDIDAQRDVTAAHGREAVFDTPQVTRHQGEQVGRFHERVFPGRPVPAVVLGTVAHRVAVGQQHRITMLLGDHRGGELAHHVRAVEVIGDLAEAFGLALGAEHRTGLVQAFQGGVGFRVDLHAGVDAEALAARVQGQVAVVDLVVVARQQAVVELHREQFQQLAIQHQRRQARTGSRVAAHHQLRMDQGMVLEQLEGQVRLVDQVVRCLIVLQIDHLRLFGAHEGVLLLMHGELVGRVFTDIDHAGVKDQVLALDPHQRAFGNRVFVQVEADHLGRVVLDRVTDFQRFDIAHRLDRLQAETRLQGGKALGTGLEQLLAHRLEVHRRRIALEQGAPVGLVGHLAAKQVLDEAGLLTGRHTDDRQRLAGALVEPAGRQLGGAGDADLDPRRIGQVDHMVGHAEFFTPGRLAAGAGVVMAALGTHDAGVALGQLGHARVAITLAEAGLGLASTMGAMNRPEEFQAQLLADQRVDRHLAVTQAKGVLHVRAFKARRHLADCTAAKLDQWMASDLNRMFGTGADFEAHSCAPM